MKTSLLVFVSLVALADSQRCIACVAPPPLYSESPDALIARSTRVILARAVAAEELPQKVDFERRIAAQELPERLEFVRRMVAKEIPEIDYDWSTVRYKFKSIETLIGPNPEIFDVVGTAPREAEELSDFDGHAAPNFWSQPAGRAAWYPDCQFYPSFAVGQTYLMFLDKPYGGRSFELIRVPPVGVSRDRWLHHVREQIRKRKPAPR